MREQRCEKLSQLVVWYRNFLEDGKSAAFVSCVSTRYGVATLERMTQGPNNEVRRAAVLALGMVGNANSIGVVAKCLQDPDRCVRLVAEIAFADLSRRQVGVNAGRLLDVARRHIDGHRYGAAAELLEEITSAWPEFADAWYQCAIVSFCLGQYGRAIRLARRAIELSPQHFPAHTLEARCFMETEQMDKALLSFERSFWVNPSQLVVKGYIDTLRRQLRTNDSP